MTSELTTFMNFGMPYGKIGQSVHCRITAAPWLSGPPDRQVRWSVSLSRLFLCVEAILLLSIYQGEQIVPMEQGQPCAGACWSKSFLLHLFSEQPAAPNYFGQRIYLPARFKRDTHHLRGFGTFHQFRENERLRPRRLAHDVCFLLFLFIALETFDVNVKA